jgi:RNA polymerase sigma factor (sigma-70 family)
MDATDHELLRQFATHRSEDAFRRLVNRHVGMVFSVARRVTDDPQLAEEVAQTTFAKLAQKAGELRPDDVPAGWLYHTARHLALRAVRSEQRRRQREHLAATMNTDEPGPSVVAEHLEAAMDQLPPADRDALILRYFEDRNLREVGHELGLTEDAARMRVNRALEKLRGVFGKLGITGSAAWLGTTLTASATASVPAGLCATITTTVLSGTALAAATTALITETTATTMNLFNLKTAAAILGAAAVTGTTTYLVQEREADRLRADYQTLNETHGKLAAEQQEARELIQLRDEQLERLKRDVADLPRLRAEVTALRKNSERLAAIESTIAAAEEETVEQALKGWLSRVDQLRKHLERAPDLWIPEIGLLEETDWLETVRRREVGTEVEGRMALNSLRHTAKKSLGSKLQNALDSFVRTTGQAFPTSVDQLAPFFDSSVDRSILNRYVIIPSSEVSNIGLVRTDDPGWVITEKAPVDWDYDSRLVVGTSGYGTSDFAADWLIPVVRAFREANGRDVTFTHFTQLMPYATTPEQRHALDVAVKKQTDRGE